MRYESTRFDAPTKFWQYKLKRISPSTWALFTRYGIIYKNKDELLMDWTCICSDTLKGCQKVIKERVRDRLSIGYSKV
jgi:hypothetical protein